MREEEIIHTALENLLKTTGITGKWKHNGQKEIDGKLEFYLENQLITLNTEIKRELRVHQLPGILTKARQFNPMMVVATHIFPGIKAELRKNHVAYLEANGNIYLNWNGKLVWIETQKPILAARENGNRAFTKTGARVLFHFLLDENLINRPYREIAKRAGVGLGNMNYIIQGLIETGFLIRLKEDQYKLYNKKELLEKWVRAYADRLKPNLRTGTFRFINEQDYNKWDQLQLKPGQTFWGGEAAGDLLTNYLKPDEFTLYTTETKAELEKNYRMVPDENGNIKVYKKFWNEEEDYKPIIGKPVVPPLLAYADLIHHNDRRCVETAQKIYHDFLETHI